jgi:YbgC/YbaW family acyl-CoA thioester hydrolase
VPADFSIKRRIQFAETDMAGVLHFSNYFRLMEEVEHAFWRSMDMTVYDSQEKRTVSWPRVAVACEYFSPARFEDELDIHLTLAHVGNRSATYEIEFLKGDERLALGKITAVCCEMRPDRFFAPVPIPDAIREKLTKHTAAGGRTTSKP